jgi:hypothetical protein
VVSFGYTRVTMISITRHEVPEYLQTGELYASLSLEDGEPFQVPSSATKRDPEVLNLESLRHLLESLRYWVIKDPLEVVITYVLSDTSQSACSTHMRCCSTHMLQYAHEHGASWGVETSWEVENSANGLKCLVYAHEHGVRGTSTPCVCWRSVVRWSAFSMRCRMAVPVLWVSLAKLPSIRCLV